MSAGNQITPAGAPVAPPIVPSDAAPGGKRSLEHIEDGAEAAADPKADLEQERIMVTEADVSFYF